MEIPTPPEGAKPLGLAAMIAVAQKEVPNWKQISQRNAGPGGRGQRPVAAGFQPGGGTSGETKNGENSRRSERADANPDGKMPSSTSGRMPDATGERGSPQPITLTIIERGQWPLFANTQLTLDPFTGAVLRKESFGDANLGRQVRSWTRFLHTGEALGGAGKAVAGLTSALAALLVWTGFALAWRRFFPRRSQETAEPKTISAAQAAAKE